MAGFVMQIKTLHFIRKRLKVRFHRRGTGTCEEPVPHAYSQTGEILRFALNDVIILSWEILRFALNDVIILSWEILRFALNDVIFWDMIPVCHPEDKVRRISKGAYDFEGKLCH